MMEAPSNTSRMASSALATTLFISACSYQFVHISLFIGSQHRNPSTDALDPLDPFSKDSIIQFLSGKGRKEPNRFLEKIRVGMLDAAHFFARHGMPRQKAPGSILAKHFLRALDHRGLGAAHIRENRFGGKRRAQPLEQVHDREHRRGENDQIASADGIG